MAEFYGKYAGMSTAGRENFGTGVKSDLSTGFSLPFFQSHMDGRKIRSFFKLPLP
jgi:hypothetical protein